WAAPEAQRFGYACGRYQLVTQLRGAQRFKIADDAWSKDADFGGPALHTGQAATLVPQGPEMSYTFNGTQRITMSLDPPHAPSVSISDCLAPPLGDTVVYLRGTLNNWAAQEQAAFTYSCDAYYLNVRHQGEAEFKLADAAWADALTFGATPDAVQPGEQAVALARGSDAGGAGNLRFAFRGEHTLRLAFPGGRPMLSIGPKTFADGSEAAVSDPVAASLQHDSRRPGDKAPFGAVTAGTTVQWRLRAAPGVTAATLVIERRTLLGNQDSLQYAPVARVPLVRSAGTQGDAWQGSFRFSEPAVYGYSFEAEVHGTRYVLENNRDAVYWTREKGSNGPGVVAPAPDSNAALRRWRLTVYDPAFTVPDWAADAVYYYIFPDRFRNGDPANDPRPGVDTYQDQGVEFHRHWLDRPYKPGSGDGSDAVYNNDFFGGDIAGIIDKLDYIRALGANTLYITPLFTAASNHKYDTADYRHIDPHFGTDADFTRLCDEAARRGMRVIPDTSLNHTGADSIYFDRYGKYHAHGAFEGGRFHPESPYADWYAFDLTQRDINRQYKGWVGVSDLPELDKASPSFRRFAYGAPDGVMQLWLDRGAAGWRMDVAPWVPDDFWREWRRAIKQHRPDALTVAETWFDASKYFLGDMFDSTMNYIFRSAVIDYVAGGDAQAAMRNLEYLREVYPPPAFGALMNLLSTHDVPRTLYVLGDTGPDAPAARRADARRRYLLAVFLQMTYAGAPAVYYGDEVGVTGGEDPYNRAPYPWADLGGQPDTDMLARVTQLIALRHAQPVLRRGAVLAPLHVDANVIVQARRQGDTWAVVASNNAEQPRTVRVALPPGAPAGP
ncbi:MAG: glycoside hydrolase family 13 protein, partial [Betaproteobacteria bacterium]|nr:glycoside hydrolase family 13 protein [Betaproteobacteria bacterium]